MHGTHGLITELTTVLATGGTVTSVAAAVMSVWAWKREEAMPERTMQAAPAATISTPSTMRKAVQQQAQLIAHAAHRPPPRPRAMTLTLILFN